MLVYRHRFPHIVSLGIATAINTLTAYSKDRVHVPIFGCIHMLFNFVPELGFKQVPQRLNFYFFYFFLFSLFLLDLFIICFLKFNLVGYRCVSERIKSVKHLS